MHCFFFNDTATTEIYTLSLHDALPICMKSSRAQRNQKRKTGASLSPVVHVRRIPDLTRDRKSTRLNSSHGYISYAVFCLKKKKNLKNPPLRRLSHANRTYHYLYSHC